MRRKLPFSPDLYKFTISRSGSLCYDKSIYVRSGKRSGDHAKDTESSGHIPQLHPAGEDPVTLFLMNGFQLRGIVRSFDSFAVLIEADGRQQMIYKHAISTVAPVRAVTLELQA